MLKVGCFRVSPSEVEAAPRSHRAVRKAAVIGARDRFGLTQPKAFVVLREGASEQDPETMKELPQQHVRERIGVWTYPRRVELADSLPKTTAGEAQRFRLRTV